MIADYHGQIHAARGGLPAVVSETGGPRECIRPGVSGFVADPEDEEVFLSKLELLLEDPKLRERMGLAAREFAASMSWEAVLDGLIEFHSRLVRGEARDGYSGRGPQHSRGELARKPEAHS